MKNLCVVLAAVAIVAGSCTKEDVCHENCGDKIVSLQVSVPVAVMTKVIDVIGEAKVNSLQIFLFRENGTLEGYKSVASANASFDCTVGSKDIVALVNAPVIKDIKTLQALKQKVSSLTDNAVGAFVMYGAKRQQISEASSSVNIDVSRLVARVSVSQITNSFELEQYRQSKFELKRIYLVNVAGNKEYDGTAEATVWYNKGKCDVQGEALPLICTGALQNTDLKYGTKYQTAHYFYCYPNSSVDDSSQSANQSPTRLVVELSVDGVVYYYPVTIPGIKSNHSYNISLNIKRLGSISPDIPIRISEANFTVNVNEWTEGFDKEVII